MAGLETQIMAGNTIKFPASFQRQPPAGAATQTEVCHSVCDTIQITVTDNARQGELDKVTGSPSAAPKSGATTPKSSSLEIAYVPFRDGDIMYYQGDRLVVSAEFSGCYFAVYRKGGLRRVAHIPKSHSSANDCGAVFRNLIENDPTYQLIHYFQPFIKSRDDDVMFGMITAGMTANVVSGPSKVDVWGVITKSNECYSLYVVEQDDKTFNVVGIRKRNPIDQVFAFKKT